MLWYENSDSNIAISTRVRLARNIQNIPFTSSLDNKKLKETCRMICNSILSCDLFGIKLREIEMESLGDIEVYAMLERHCISPKFAEKRDGRILLLSDDESISIMIGEEDHIRIQVLKPGIRLDEAYQLCDKIDTSISQKLEFAFNDKFGYLTECPTNVGTGMRASVMLHLPLLEKLGKLRTIARTCNEVGLTIRGFYGEGSDSKASIYQLSNQVTLGVTEKDSIEKLKSIANSIIKKEIEELNNFDLNKLEDTVCRYFGVLKYARSISTDEMMKYVTFLLLGWRAGVIKLPESFSLMNIFITMQPAMIKRIYGDITPSERDKLRADSIRRMLSNIDI